MKQSLCRKIIFSFSMLLSLTSYGADDDWKINGIMNIKGERYRVNFLATENSGMISVSAVSPTKVIKGFSYPPFMVGPMDVGRSITNNQGPCKEFILNGQAIHRENYEKFLDQDIPNRSVIEIIDELKQLDDIELRKKQILALKQKDNELLNLIIMEKQERKELKK
jgi:hypothetical protein